MTTTTIQVQGMTCEHCVRSVEEELGAVGGVTEVHAELATGTVTVQSEGPLDDGDVAAAVEEAGYEVVR